MLHRITQDVTSIVDHHLNLLAPMTVRSNLLFPETQNLPIHDLSLLISLMRQHLCFLITIYGLAKL